MDPKWTRRRRRPEFKTSVVASPEWPRVDRDVDPVLASAERPVPIALSSRPPTNVQPLDTLKEKHPTFEVLRPYRGCERMAKSLATKTTVAPFVYRDEGWRVLYGTLKRGRGRPPKGDPLFLVVGEKLPFDSLSAVAADLRDRHPDIDPTGIYLAHDSMGQVRYIGRGVVFDRLRVRRREQVLELAYFSFYIGMSKAHEREIETVLIRAVGAGAYFNRRKKREDIVAGDVRDYEAGTRFYERQYVRGKRPATRHV